MNRQPPGHRYRVTAACIASAIVLALFPYSANAAAGVTVTPDHVLPGQSVAVNGTDWAPFDQILVSFTDASGNIIPLGIISADAGGAFKQVITVPSTVPPGVYRVDGNAQGGSVSVELTVLAPTATPAPPTSTPSWTATPAPPTATLAPEQPTPTFTPPPTTTATPTATPTPTPTNTPTSTPTATTTPTVTSTPTLTSTPTSTPTNTPTLPQRAVSVSQTTGFLQGLVVVLLAVIAFLLLRRRPT